MQFLLRRETLQLYRQFLKVLVNISDNERRVEMRKWIRSEFEMAANTQDNDDEVCAIIDSIFSVQGINYPWCNVTCFLHVKRTT